LTIPFAILAQATQAATRSTGAKPELFDYFKSPLFLFTIVILIFYLFLFKNKKSQESQRKTMLDQLKRGDRIKTIGGILGTVVEAKDDEVLVKVDESSNTKIRFARSAIHQVLEQPKN
jgi:preprotein translocase subunit YajC